MSSVALQVRSICTHALVLVLFPFVFAATLIEQVAPGWASGFALGFRWSLVFSAMASALLLAGLSLFGSA